MLVEARPKAGGDPVLVAGRSIGCPDVQRQGPGYTEYEYQFQWDSTFDCLNADYTLTARFDQPPPALAEVADEQTAVVRNLLLTGVSTSAGGAEYVVYDPFRQEAPTTVSVEVQDEGPRGDYTVRLTTNSAFAPVAEQVLSGPGRATFTLTPTDPARTAVSGFQVVVGEAGGAANVTPDEQRLRSERLTPSLAGTTLTRQGSAGTPPPTGVGDWLLASSFAVTGGGAAQNVAAKLIQPDTQVGTLARQPATGTSGALSARWDSYAIQHGLYWLVVTGADDLTQGSTSARDRRSGPSKSLLAACGSFGADKPIELDVGLAWDQRANPGFGVALNDNNDEGNTKLDAADDPVPAADNEEDWMFGHRIVAGDTQLREAWVWLRGPVRGQWQLDYDQSKILVWREDAARGYAVVDSGVRQGGADTLYPESSQAVPVLIEGLLPSDSARDVPITATFVETSGPGGTDAANGTVDDLKLCSVTFDRVGGGLLAVKRDRDGADYPGAQWQDTSVPLDNDADDPATGATEADHRWPVLYKVGDRVKLTATVRVPLSRPGPWVVAARVLNGDFTLPPSAATANIGNEVTVNLEAPADRALPDKIRCIDPLVIRWCVASTDGVESVVTESRNEFLVAVTAPAAADALQRRHTVANISCRGGDNSASASTDKEKTDLALAVFGVFAKERPEGVWRVAEPNNPARPAVHMTYYGNWGTHVWQAEGLLASSDGDGQCGSWEYLLRACLGLQGLGSISQRRSFYALALDSFAVRHWNFPATGTDFTNKPRYANPAGDVQSGFYDFDWPEAMTGKWAYHWDGTAQVKDETGLPGQGNSNPQSLFGAHFLTRLRTGPAATDYLYLDPSYGLKTVGTTALEAVYEWYNGAVDGWWKFETPVLSMTGREHFETVAFQRFSKIEKREDAKALKPDGY